MDSDELARAKRLIGQWAQLQAIVLSHILDKGWIGVTDAEGARVVCIPLPLYVARRGELEALGLIGWSGYMRPGQDEGKEPEKIWSATRLAMKFHE